MTSAGDLRSRVRFERREQVSDGAGNFENAWAAQFERRAQVKPLQGGETVIAQRLQGKQPALIIVRFDSQTCTITPDWRAVDARTGTVYAIRSAADMENARQWWTMMAEAGVAA